MNHADRGHRFARHLGPRSAPMAPVMLEWISAPVPAMTRAVNVDALNSCSAYKISDVCIARTHKGDGALLCRRCKKWPPTESSSVSVSIRLPL